MIDRLSNEDHVRVAQFVEREAGIQLPAHKSYLIESRLAKRKSALGFSNFSDYFNYVFEQPPGHQERVAVIESLTTHKTEFFREREHFNFLISDVLPKIQAQRDIGISRPFRVWSAGCSSGEEAYTLAMVLSEFKQLQPAFRFEVLASDISNRIIVKAENAVYTHDVIEPVDPVLRRKYLLRSKRDSNIVRVSKPLRDSVRFFQLNLLRDAFKFPHSIDAIFCRNVMIYFNERDRSMLLHKFIKALGRPGYLFIGHSERLGEHIRELRAEIPTVYSRSNC